MHTYYDRVAFYYVDLPTLCSLYSVSFGNGNGKLMGIDSESFDGH